MNSADANRTESIPGELASDGIRLQCHECGRWFISLSSHIRRSHGISAAAYRERWGLKPRTPLIGGESRIQMRAYAMQRYADAGSAAGRGFVGTGPVTPGPALARFADAAATLWPRRLESAGWADWGDAVAWAERNDATWAGIARKLDASPAAVINAVAGTGLHLRTPTQRLLDRAGEHLATHGTLLDVDHDLTVWFRHARHRETLTEFTRDVAAQLDALDPRWRLTGGARTKALREAAVRSRRATRDHRYTHAKIVDAGFVDATDLVRWAITGHHSTTEIAELIGAKSDTVLARLRIASVDDPFAATSHLILSGPGHLEDDGQRQQCHECGLWFAMLDQHLRCHTGDDGEPLTVDDYRLRHQLPADEKLRGPDKWRDAMWRTRLEAHGFTSWDDVIGHAAREHLGPLELAAMFGSGRHTVWSLIVDSQTERRWAAAAPYQLSRHGVLADDGARVQCHECGLWLSNLNRHVTVHADAAGAAFTVASYRNQHGLAPTQKLASQVSA